MGIEVTQKIDAVSLKRYAGTSSQADASPVVRSTTDFKGQAASENLLKVRVTDQLGIQQTKTAPKKSNTLLSKSKMLWPRMLKLEGPRSDAMGRLKEPVEIQAVPGPVVSTSPVSLRESLSITALRREMYTTNLKAGKITTWLKTEGAVNMPGINGALGYYRPAKMEVGFNRNVSDMYVGWENRLNYELEIPVTREIKSPPLQDVEVAVALQAHRTLPMSADQALNMPKGSRLILKGQGFLGLGYYRDEKGGPVDRPEQDARLLVDFVGDGKVSIALKASDTRNKIMRLWSGLGGRNLRLGSTVVTEPVVLDLNIPEHRFAYERMLALELETGLGDINVRRHLVGGRLKANIGLTKEFTAELTDTLNGSIGAGFAYYTDIFSSPSDPRIRNSLPRRQVLDAATTEGKGIVFVQNNFVIDLRAGLDTAGGVSAGGQVKETFNVSFVMPVTYNYGDSAVKRLASEVKGLRDALVKSIQAMVSGGIGYFDLPEMPAGSSVTLTRTSGTSIYINKGGSVLTSVGGKAAGATFGIRGLKGDHLQRTFSFDKLGNDLTLLRRIDQGSTIDQLSADARAGYDVFVDDIPTEQTEKHRLSENLQDGGLPNYFADPLTKAWLKQFRIGFEAIISGDIRSNRAEYVYDAFNLDHEDEQKVVLSQLALLNEPPTARLPKRRIIRGPFEIVSSAINLLTSTDKPAQALEPRLIIETEQRLEPEPYNLNINLGFMRFKNEVKVSRTNYTITALDEDGKKKTATGSMVRGTAEQVFLHARVASDKFNMRGSTLSGMGVNGAAGRPQYLAEIDLSGRALFTSVQDALAFLDRLQAMGVPITLVEEQKLRAAAKQGRYKDSGWIMRHLKNFILSPHGEMQYQLNAIIDTKGLLSLAKVNPREVVGRYARNYVKLSKPDGASLWALADNDPRRKTAFSLLERYADLSLLVDENFEEDLDFFDDAPRPELLDQVLKTLPGFSGEITKSNLKQVMGEFHEEYMRLLSNPEENTEANEDDADQGPSMVDDLEIYAQASLLSSIFESFDSEVNSLTSTRLFAGLTGLTKELSTDANRQRAFFWPALATIFQLAKGDEIQRFKLNTDSDFFMGYNNARPVAEETPQQLFNRLLLQHIANQDSRTL